ncbi:hypothetical protein AVEN_248438-1 [Araneus ventricosus]|uniref:Uncharacterized protein n=1 Tax=Araneus ventricosus TaxID=182803 RepID=A0A4Y1ZLH6_ARAVE|nr:hypothetical protein AVEN_248438-1 [Araneus ventricosus]
MFNRDSSVKSTCPHCSGVQLHGPIHTRFNVRWGQRHTNNRSSCEQSSFMQSARHSLAGYGPSCSSRELRLQLSRCLCSPASGTLQQVATVCRCGDPTAFRPRLLLTF